MNRRTALFSSLALGGVLSRALFAQDRPAGRTRTADTPEPEFRPSQADDPAASGEFNQTGHRWRIFNIARYIDLPHSDDTERPEAALVDWILRATGSETWHGADLAVLNASPTELRVYHNLKTLELVTDIVKRFVDSVFDVVTLRVRVVVAADPRWRYAVYSQLEPKATGPMGQQAWLVDLGTAEMALAQMGISQNFRKIYDQRHKMVNGQTLFVKTVSDEDYYSGLDRSSSSSLGYEPKIAKIEQGVELRLSPLLNYDGTGIDLALDLKASSLRKLHATKVIAPRRIGPAEMNVDVPEFAASRMNQTIADWPLDKNLVISAGILPGILQEKGGFMANIRLPGVQPYATELLVLFDVSTNLQTGRSSEDPDEKADPDTKSDEPIARKPRRAEAAPKNERARSRSSESVEELDPDPSGFRPVDGSSKGASRPKPAVDIDADEPEPPAR